MINNNTKILVTGCGGMLGEAAYKHFSQKCLFYPTDIDVSEPWLDYLDVTDYESVREKVIQIKPDYIFHFAALIDMEYSERNPHEAYKINSLGTEQVATICHEFEIPLVYISSASVFDDSQQRYTEYDIPNPVHVYGKSVHAGERFIQELLKKYFIFRTGWMIGGGPKKDKKFVKTLMTYLQNGDTEILVGDDKFGAPTYTYDLMKTIQSVLELNHPGIYNVVCEGGCSKYEVAKHIIALLHLQDKININIGERSDFKQKYFAPRPDSSGLLNLKLKIKNLPIPQSCKACLAEYFQNYPWAEELSQVKAIR